MTIEELPSECSVAIGLGDGDHRVRILSCDERPSDSTPLRTSCVRALWDLDNKVAPLCTDATQRAKASGTDSLVSAEQMLHDMLVEEAGRLGEAPELVQAPP